MLHQYKIDPVGVVTPTVMCLCGADLGDIQLAGYPPEIDYEH